MNRSRKNNIYSKYERSNFVVLHNDFMNIDNKKVREKRPVKFLHSSEIVEYTDDVSEQMRALYIKISANLEEYYKCITSIIEIEEKVRQSYYSIKSYCIHTGFISDSDEAFKSKLLKDVYRSYRHNAVVVAMDMNELEGKELELKYLKGDSPFVYYNSEYYYRCEDLREKIITIVKELANDENIKDFETASIDKRKRYIYDYEFNQSWFLKHKVSTITNVEYDDLLVLPNQIKILYQPPNDKILEGKLIVFLESQKVEYPINQKDLGQDRLYFLNLFSNMDCPIQ